MSAIFQPPARRADPRLNIHENGRVAPRSSARERDRSAAAAAAAAAEDRRDAPPAIARGIASGRGKLNETWAAGGGGRGTCAQRRRATRRDATRAPHNAYPRIYRKGCGVERESSARGA